MSDVPERNPSLTGVERGPLHQQRDGAASLDQEISTALSQEVVQLTAALEVETARAGRLARCVGSEVAKREASQDKGRRLLAQRLTLEAEVACLRLKRGKTAATFRAVRLILREERLAAGHHFVARKAAEEELLEVRAEAELLLAQSTHATLGLAKLMGRADSLRTQLAALQELHSNLRLDVGCQRLTHAQQLEACRLDAAAARAKAATSEGEMMATAEAHANLLDEVAKLDAERTRVAVEMEAAGEALKRALMDAEQARMKALARASEVAGLRGELDAAREEVERLRGGIFALQLEGQERQRQGGA